MSNVIRMPMEEMGHNLPSAREWLKAVLHSGEVTRVGQHLALVIFHAVDENGHLDASVRDLERITGWGRQTIADHLGELRAFMNLKLGTGRAKSEFDLQCKITRAVNELRSVRETDRNVPIDTSVSVHVPDTSVRLLDTKPEISVDSVREPDPVPDAKPDTTVASSVVASQPDTKPEPSRACIESSLREDISTLERDNPPFIPQDPKTITFEKGQLKLFGSLKDFWLEEFGGDEKLLQLALIQAAAYVQPNSFKPLESQVSAQLARRACDKRDKDARYALAVKQNAKSATKPEHDPYKHLTAESRAKLEKAGLKNA